MDMKEDPCNDFSQFVCGKYYKNDTISETHSLSFDSAVNNRKLSTPV